MRSETVYLGSSRERLPHSAFPCSARNGLLMIEFLAARIIDEARCHTGDRAALTYAYSVNYTALVLARLGMEVGTQEPVLLVDDVRGVRRRPDLQEVLLDR